ncbi:hypothetical protein RFI_37434 [Reticulomyxa filosa]|uniref:Uncharacterized protein n=1 Tax=Reticulomyxa filosa TaxID=46433 RepID=X6LH16_RETFI|nr:hypothetical protein RFI_37434 [Reticulomyxa filosa]|eukprot:ETO00025.1 hypothetical protein RFI_37434 [Reticulomyxa filosa]
MLYVCYVCIYAGLFGLQLEIPEIVRQKLIKDDKFFVDFAEGIKDLYDSVICKHCHLIDDLPNQMNFVDENDSITKCPLTNDNDKINLFNYGLTNLSELQELIVKIEKADWKKCDKKSLASYV